MTDYKGPMPGETVEALRARVAVLERENARLRLLEEAAIRAVMEEAGGLTVARFALKMTAMQRQRDALKQAVRHQYDAGFWCQKFERLRCLNLDIAKERTAARGELAACRQGISDYLTLTVPNNRTSLLLAVLDSNVRPVADAAERVQGELAELRAKVRRQGEALVAEGERCLALEAERDRLAGELAEARRREGLLREFANAFEDEVPGAQSEITRLLEDPTAEAPDFSRLIDEFADWSAKIHHDLAEDDYRTLADAVQEYLREWVAEDDSGEVLVCARAIKRAGAELAKARGEIGRLDHVMKSEARLMERLAGTMDTD